MKKIVSALLMGAVSFTAYSEPPRLVVQIVVDQLRGDLLQKYKAKFGSQGFNYLLNNSINFQNAHHPHAHTVTCAGHATIATGTYPALHGIIANDWYDRTNGHEVYCMEDTHSKILSTQRTKKEAVGRSPRNIMASTLSDELVLAKKGRAFGVSLKDRGAITLAGHAGKAFWFDKDNGGFISSNYYYQQYPQWVNDWNGHYVAKEEIWTLSRPLNSYAIVDNAPTHKLGAYGQTFPHSTGKPTQNDYYEFLATTPVADELTADFAIQLLNAERLGKTGHKTDYLGVSFSAVDKIGHMFGPNSLESEDSLLRLDNTLARFFSAIDQQVGLQNTLIVLTADHGVADSQSYLSTHHINKRKEVAQQTLQQIITQKLLSEFKLPAETLQAIDLPFVYLNHDIITQHHLSTAQVSTVLADTLRLQTGIFDAFALPLTITEKNWLNAKVDKMAYMKRAGDLYLVPPPYQRPEDQHHLKGYHGTPWQYDSFVPLLFANPDFKAKKSYTSVKTTDIAATLAAILEIKAPSASVGKPLMEVVAQYNR